MGGSQGPEHKSSVLFSLQFSIFWSAGNSFLALTDQVGPSLTRDPTGDNGQHFLEQSLCFCTCLDKGSRKLLGIRGKCSGLVNIINNITQ